MEFGKKPKKKKNSYKKKKINIFRMKKMKNFIRTFGDVVVGIVGMAFFALMAPFIVGYSLYKHFTTTTQTK